MMFLLAQGLVAAPLPGAFPLDDQPIARPILMLFILVILALAPFLVMMMTSFVKIAVVFSLLRNAMGTQQIPPNQIVNGLAIILTIYIMVPVGTDVYNSIKETIHDPQVQSQPVLSQTSFNVVKKAVNAGKEPIRQFLLKQSSAKDRNVFYTLAKKLRGPEGDDSIKDDDFLILVPSFMITELTEAFQIGFILFLPFLVIDMVVSNILLAMGMFMVSPVTVSFPFKLLLFVLVDGWALITKGLILGYMK